MAKLTTRFPLNAESTIPAVGYGTYLISPEDTEGAVRTAIANGYRHIDTAAAYQNEEAVGRGIAAGLADAGLSRSDLFVTTKLWPGNAAWGDAPRDGTQTQSECKASLARLGLDYVDLYLIHAPYGGPQRVAQWKALVALQAQGKARAIGVSNYNPEHLMEIHDAGLPMPDANQIELHPWSQKPELLAVMQQHGIAPIAYSSLAPLSTWRTEPGQDSAKTEAMRTDGHVFADIAAQCGVTEAQLLLRWGVQKGYAVLPRSLNLERLRENIDLDGFSVSPEHMAHLDNLDRGDGIAWATGDPRLNA